MRMSCHLMRGSDRTKARIIVDSFSTVPEEVYAGQPFELRVRMKNASSNVTSSKYHVYLCLGGISGQESCIHIGFRFYLHGSQSVRTRSNDGSFPWCLNPPTAEQKSHTMTIVEQYDSPEFKNAKEEVKISIPVKTGSEIEYRNN